MPFKNRTAARAAAHSSWARTKDRAARTACTVEGCPEPARYPGADRWTHYRAYRRDVAARALALRLELDRV
ncbi:MAG: hypothetical protein QOD10_2835 [Mycobacterium sp.]|jgi:hypothetical protein|nr:hypothetical protein [Mycobacterium sp.]